MNDINLEKKLNNCPDPVSIKGTETILFQMKNCICQIIKSSGEKGTGFFCKIPLNGKMIPMLATNNHVLKEEDIQNNKSINLLIKNDKKQKKKTIKINQSRIKFTNVELDFTFIEIKPFIDNVFNFLEIEEDLLNRSQEVIELEYQQNSIYILHCPNEPQVSYGVIKSIQNTNILHFMTTYSGSSGSPILSLKTFKVIGIHKGAPVVGNFNVGLLINNILNKFSNYNNNNNNNFNNSNKDFTYYKSWNKIENNYINNRIREQGETPHIIIYINDDYCYAGFDGEDEPDVCFLTCIGYPIYQMSNANNNEIFIGSNALNKYELNINFPYRDGKVRNWDQMEKIFEYIFVNELKVNPSNHNNMLFDNLINNNKSKKKIFVLMFETFKVKGLYILSIEHSVVIAAGKFLGFCVILEEGETTMLPIFDGRLFNNKKRLSLKGNDITQYLMKLIEKDIDKF